MSFDLIALKDEASALLRARPRRSVDLATQTLVRVLPIRWRLFSIAALNATVAVILALLIWKGANVLSAAWEDVRRVRESDKLLVQLRSEASRLQNLIHRYINQPNQEVLAEILGLHGDVLSTLRNRGAVDPVLLHSADELRVVTERFLQGFGEVREVQTTISQTYENEVLKPAKDMAGLYAIIEGCDRQARRPVVALAGKIARGVHREPGCRQCLLSLARFGRRRRGARKDRDRGADHPRDDRPRGKQPAARRAGGAGSSAPPRFATD